MKQSWKGRHWMGLLLLLLMLLPASGCIRPRSVERFGYVMAIGMDAGTRLPYRMTLMLQKNQSDTGAQKKAEAAFLSAECNNLYEAVETLTANLPVVLDFSRTVMVVLSTDLLAGDPDLLDSLLSGDYGDLRMRSGIHIMAALGAADEALQGLQSDFQLNVARIQQKLSTYSKTSGLIPVASAARLKEALAAGTFDCALPLIGVTEKTATRAVEDSIGERDYAYIGGRMLVEGGMESGIMGTALLSKTEFCGILDGRNTQLLLMGTGDFAEGRMSFLTESGTQVVVYLERRRPIGRSLEWADRPRVKVSIPLRGRVELGGGVSGEREALERWLAERLEEELQTLLAALQSRNCDAMGFGKLAVMGFSDSRSWEDARWRQNYRNTEAIFDVSVRLED